MLPFSWINIVLVQYKLTTKRTFCVGCQHSARSVACASCVRCFYHDVVLCVRIQILDDVIHVYIILDSSLCSVKRPISSCCLSVVCCDVHWWVVAMTTHCPWDVQRHWRVCHQIGAGKRRPIYVNANDFIKQKPVEYLKKYSVTSDADEADSYDVIYRNVECEEGESWRTVEHKLKNKWLLAVNTVAYTARVVSEVFFYHVPQF